MRRTRDNARCRRRALPEQLPEGTELPDGRILTFAPHRECPCGDRTAAFEAWRRGRWSR
ncbi:MAG: hypothetical protein H0W11_01700 [Gemmatimonadetes bacterium]|nr:hypothetical protein [Gemmatimonadota bacterium]